MMNLVGQEVGQYKLLRLLGQGDSAYVYLGEHKQHQSYVAVKVQATNGWKAREGNEVSILSHVTHPHIPQGKTVSFLNIDFQGNNQVGNNAFIKNEGTLNITNSHISQFQSSDNGGAVYNLNGGKLTFSQSELESNKSLGDGGGAIYNFNAILVIDNSNIHDNQAENYNGGGIDSLNGQVFIQNKSHITSNQVLNAPSGGDLGGGGGMTIHGGIVSVSDSSVERNNSEGNGGGILLIGAGAQIYNSSIQYNATNTGQAGGIAVVYNPENNYSSFLILADSTIVQYNSNLNAKSSTDFAVNIQGKVVGEDAANTSINSESGAPRPASDPTTFKQQFLGYLTLKSFRTYCQSQQNSQKQPFTDALLSFDGQTITCTSSNGETLTLSTQKRNVNQVCAMLYPEAKLTLARLFRYNDSTTWQCFQDEQLLSAITKPIPSTNKAPLDSYCHNMGASAELVPEPNQPANAYDWDCKQGTVRLSITMDVACQNVTKNPLALGMLVDHANPYSWECWGPE